MKVVESEKQCKGGQERRDLAAGWKGSGMAFGSRGEQCCKPFNDFNDLIISSSQQLQRSSCQSLRGQPDTRRRSIAHVPLWRSAWPPTYCNPDHSLVPMQQFITQPTW